MTADAAGGERDPSGDGPRAAAAACEQGNNPLQHLIQQRLRERGWSYGEVARRGGLPRSTVYTLAMTRNLARPPRPATLDRLAKGLDVPVSAVRAAAAKMGAAFFVMLSPYALPAGGNGSDDIGNDQLLLTACQEVRQDHLLADPPK